MTTSPSQPAAGVDASSLGAKVEFLRRPEAYPEGTTDVRCVETHMSWVFLTDRHAYKLKKPIRYDVLDFSRLELRLRSCRRELELNRRLAPRVYLGVVALTVEGKGQLRLAGTGPVVDWLVKMVRLPGERMLDRVISEGVVRPSDVEPAATLLARFYRRATAAPVDGPGYRAHLAEGVQADLDELVAPQYELPANAVRRIAASQLRYLREAAEVLNGRVHEGRVVEGHGDLRPEHVCLTEPPAVIDCLEFSRDLRILDPADELSFLALECERLGAPAVGQWFLGRYREVTGDDPPTDLLLFYRRFRALRRAKIAVWHLREPGIDRADEWRSRAEWYIRTVDPEAEPTEAAA